LCFRKSPVDDWECIRDWLAQLASGADKYQDTWSTHIEFVKIDDDATFRSLADVPVTGRSDMEHDAAELTKDTS
jgi:hypothetical protein